MNPLPIKKPKKRNKDDDDKNDDDIDGDNDGDDDPGLWLAKFEFPYLSKYLTNEAFFYIQLKFHVFLLDL
jgi:hypothetical protein